jgi:hypothetical protein
MVCKMFASRRPSSLDAGGSKGGDVSPSKVGLTREAAILLDPPIAATLFILRPGILIASDGTGERS